MRVSTAAVCSLAVLAAQELTHGAIAHAATLPESPEPQNTTPSDKSLTLALTPTPPTVEMTAPAPERLTSPAAETATRTTQTATIGTAWASEPTAPSPKIAATSVAIATTKQLETAVAAPQPAIAPPEVLAIAPRTSAPAVSRPSVANAPSASVATAAAVTSSARLMAVAQPCARPGAIQTENTGTECAIAQVESAPLPTQPAQPEAPPTDQEFEELQRQLREVSTSAEDFGDVFGGSPAITISNPSGFGADRNTAFLNFSYQNRTRFSNVSDGSAGIGFGIGDATRNVGLELSYTVASFGGSRSFGTGGFNAKLHRQFGNGLSAALGWEGFITTGFTDFSNTVYGSLTQVIRTRPNLDDPFSRIAITAGLGNGRFRSESDVANDVGAINVFGSVAVRVARPVSAIVEWTGQDLALGLSIAPFRNVPLVITPALRDVTGAGDGARFVLGAGIAVRF